MGLVKRYAYKVTSGTNNAAFHNSLDYWPLQEPSGVRYNFAGPANLTDVGGVAFSSTAGPGGAYPGAALFVAAGPDYLSVADPFPLGSGVAFSAWGWAYLASKGADRTLISQWDGGTQCAFVVGFTNGSDRLRFFVDASGTPAGLTEVQATSFGSPPLNTWFYWRVYHDNTNIGIQINGGAVNTAAHAGGVFNSTTEFRIGYRADNTEPWDGRMAGVGVSIGGIATEPGTLLYNGGVPVSPLGVLFDVTETGIEFPLGDYEYAPSQALRVPRAPIAGADYDFRLLGGYPGLKGAAQERIRFTGMGDGTFLDALVDSQMGIQNYGLCRLWTIGDDGSERWAWVSLANMPEYTLSIPATLLPATLTFDRWSNWFSKFKTLSHVDTGNTGDTFHTETVEGNALVNDAVITIRGDSWTNPFWNNSPTWLNNLYLGNFSTARDISSNLHRIRADGGRHKVEWSTDNGLVYANDYSNYSRTGGQLRLTVLAPGGNLFVFQGTRTNTRALIEYFDQWHS